MALLQPSSFLAFLDQGWWAIRRAVFIALGIHVSIVGLLWLVINQMTPLSTRGVLASAIITPMLVVMMIALGAISVRTDLSYRTSFAFWILGGQIAITPTWVFIIALMYTPVTSAESAVWLFAMLLPLSVGLAALFGLTCATVLLLTLLLHGRLQAAISLRWGIAFVAFAAAMELWWQPVFAPYETLLCISALLGVTIGLLRGLSWLWETGVSTILMLALRAGAKPTTVRRLHPVSFDELSLLPLPGLSRVLAHVCRVEPTLGLSWLYAVAQHPGQYCAARRALNSVIRTDENPHPILWAVSTTPAGVALLRTMVQIPACPGLVRAYLALSSVTEAGAWASTLARVRPQLQHPAGAADLLTVLQVSSDILTAADWQSLVAATRLLPPANPTDSSLLTTCRQIILESLSSPPTAQASIPAAQPQSIIEQIQAFDGWPRLLLAAVHEQMIFLQRIDPHQQGPCDALR